MSTNTWSTFVMLMPTAQTPKDLTIVAAKRAMLEMEKTVTVAPNYKYKIYSKISLFVGIREI